MARSIIVSVFALGLLSGCAYFEEPQPVDVRSDILNRDVSVDSQEVYPEIDWWSSLGSSTLVSLLDRAERGNPDLAKSVVRIARSEAEASRNRASLLPSVNADAGASRNTRPWVDPPMDGGGASWNASLRASYEIDLWGENASSVEAAEMRIRSSKYDHEAVAISLFSEIGRSYISLLSLEDERHAVEKNLELADQVASITAVRVEQGASSGLENAQQRSVIASLKARLSDIERQIAERRTALAILLGEPPPLQLDSSHEDNLLDIAVPSFHEDQIHSLVYNRPDIKAIESELMAADADIQVARAELLPSLSLSASGSASADAFRALFDPAHLVFTITGNIAQAVFDGGAREASLKLTELQKISLLEDYRSTMLTAMGEGYQQHPI